MIDAQNKTTTLYSYQKGIGANTEAILNRTLRHILYGDLYDGGGNGGDDGGNGGGDEHWDKVVVLQHFDGDLTDETGRVWNLGGSVLTEDGRFGGGLRRYGGEDSTYTDPLELYGDTYTIEFWYRQDANKGQFSAIFAVAIDAILLRVNPGGGIELLTNDDTYVGSGISPIIGGWYHICIQRNDEGVLGWYVDGIYRGGIVSNPFNGHVFIGYSPKDPNNAWFTLDELRITKGVARYTANFTPPTEPFPDN